MIPVRALPGRFAAFFLLALTVLALAGCAKKEVQPLPVGELTDYKDPAYGYRISYPKEWLANAEIGRAQFFNAQDVDNRFRDPEGAFPDGAMIGLTFTKTTAAAALRDSAISSLAASGYQIAPAQQITVAGKPAMQYTYSARFGSGTQTGQHVYIALDTALYDIWTAGFGDFNTLNKDVFAASLNSFQFPKVAAAGVDPSLPSDSYSDGNNKYFTYKYPENFSYSPVDKGSFEYSEALHNNTRLDCTVRFDVFDAKGQGVEKVFEQNKGRYRATGSGKITVGGDPASFVAYAAGKDVNVRAYFVVHGGKAYRITTTWYRPQEKEYAVAYEKLLSSIKFK